MDVRSLGQLRILMEGQSVEDMTKVNGDILSCVNEDMYFAH